MLTTTLQKNAVVLKLQSWQIHYLFTLMPDMSKNTDAHKRLSAEIFKDCEFLFQYYLIFAHFLDISHGILTYLLKFGPIKGVDAYG